MKGKRSLSCYLICDSIRVPFIRSKYIRTVFIDSARTANSIADVGMVGMRFVLLFEICSDLMITVWILCKDLSVCNQLLFLYNKEFPYYYLYYLCYYLLLQMMIMIVLIMMTI